MPAALEGIEVVDLTRLAPGPYCTMFLGDLGARVTRVEEFGSLSGRRAGESHGAFVNRGGASGMPEEIGFVDPHSPYNALNRNKRSIALNLKMEAGREVFFRMVKKADVVVEEFRPGVTKRLGIDYDSIKELNPRIIYCAITGYGQYGPYRDFVGHDINFLSMSGALSIMGKKGEAPLIPANIIGDYGTGIQAVVGIMAAIIAREKTERGQFVDIALADSVISLLAHMLSWSYATGHVPEQGEHCTAGFYPFYNVYETKDGKYFSIGCNEPWFYANLCRILGHEELIPFQFTKDERKRAEIFETFRSIFLTKTRDEWFEFFPKTEIPVGKVHSFGEISADVQVQARQMIVEMTGPNGEQIKQAGIPIKLQDTPGSIRFLGPRMGQHTREVLLENGYNDGQINSLAATGVVMLPQ